MSPSKLSDAGLRPGILSIPVNSILPSDRSEASDSPEQLHVPSGSLRFLSRDEWKTAIASFQYPSVFHSWEWIDLLARTYRYTPVLACIGSPRTPDAVLPLLEVRSMITGCRAVSLPFTDVCEPLAHDPAASKRLMQEILELAPARGWKRVEFRGGSPVLPDAQKATNFYQHQLDLTIGEARLNKNVDSSVRRAVRKADQSAVTVEFSTSAESVNQFYQLLSLTRRRHGVPPQPFRFFAGLQQQLLAPGLGTVVLARLGSTPIAGALYLFSGKRVVYKYGASDEAYQHVRGNNLVMWRAIAAFAQQGYAELDFGRTSLDNEGLRAFKLSWGAKENISSYLVHDVGERAWIKAPDRSSGWHNKVFRQLPLPISRWIGQILYRHIG